jgi:hypothetical protein
MPILSRVAAVASRLSVIAAMVVLLLGAALPGVASANSSRPVRVGGSQAVPVYAGHSPRAYRPIAAPSLYASKSKEKRKTSTIQVSYHGFGTNSPQKAAFQAAVDVWQSIIVSDQVIHVDATWEPLDEFVLGSAGPSAFYYDGPYVYPVALEEARCHCDLEDVEIEASFNSTFGSWYLGTDGNVPNSKWDFESVVLHELGHGLGFLSSFEVHGSRGYWGFGGKPLKFDANEWSAASGGNKMTSYANGSTTLKTQLTDGTVFLGGTNLQAVLGKRAKLYAPGTWDPGSSNSHFDEARFSAGTANALMTPVLNNGESIHNPGAATVAVMQDIGWSVAGSSDDTTAPAVETPVVSIKSSQKMTKTLTVRVDWPDATDPSGIASYELQRQEGAGAWTSVGLNTTTSSFGDVAVTRGSNYVFRVRATDGVGNTGPWSTTSSGHINTVQEDAGSVAYSAGWTRSSLTGAAGKMVMQSSTANATATFSFTGSAVAFVSTKASGRGVATVSLDGGSAVQVDLRAATKQVKRVVWSSDPLSNGPHTVTITVTGTTSGTSTRVDVDAFLTWP